MFDLTFFIGGMANNNEPQYGVVVTFLGRYAGWLKTIAVMSFLGFVAVAVAVASFVLMRFVQDDVARIIGAGLGTLLGAGATLKVAYELGEQKGRSAERDAAQEKKGSIDVLRVILGNLGTSAASLSDEIASALEGNAGSAREAGRRLNPIKSSIITSASQLARHLEISVGELIDENLSGLDQFKPRPRTHSGGGPGPGGPRPLGGSGGGSGSAAPAPSSGARETPGNVETRTTDLGGARASSVASEANVVSGDGGTSTRAQNLAKLVEIAERLDKGDGYTRKDRDHAMALATALASDVNREGWPDPLEKHRAMTALEQLIDTLYKSDQVREIGVLHEMFGSEMTASEGIVATLIQQYGRELIISEGIKNPESKDWRMFQIYADAAKRSGSPHLNGAALAFEAVARSRLHGGNRDQSISSLIGAAENVSVGLEIFLFTAHTLSRVKNFQKKPTPDGQVIAGAAEKFISSYDSEIKRLLEKLGGPEARKIAQLRSAAKAEA